MNGNIRASWFEQRSKIYAQLAKGLPIEADNVKFRFNPPYCGSIDMYILVENKVNMLIPIDVYNFSFSMLRTFLENIVKDDVFNPDMTIYEDSDILFSIRPPAELQEAIMKIRDEVNATLIIKPLFNEDLNMKTKKMKLKNYNRASFYIYER